MRQYLSLIKFSHTVFALPFAVIGFLLALRYSSSEFEWKVLLLVILCMVFARSAAMAFNRLVDKDIDKVNPRTALREIPSDIIKYRSALIFVVINAVLFIITTKLINNLCFYLSPVALAVILGYSYTKRFTPLCHLILGLGLSLAPIGSYLAVTEEFALLPLFFSFAVLCWVSGFDIIYALQDIDFDRSQKLFSIPALLGCSRALWVSILLHICTVISIVSAGWYGNWGMWYWTGCILFTSLLIYQHLLVKPNDLSKVNLAFFTLNGLGSLIFAIFVGIELTLF